MGQSVLFQSFAQPGVASTDRLTNRGTVKIPAYKAAENSSFFLCDEGSLSALYKVGRVPGGDYQNFGNKIMTTLGLASVVYTLGMKDAAVLTVKKVVDINGNKL